MSKIKLTADQQAAVSTRGSSLLVSAAAGSGKTRVLTERLMAYVCDEAHPKSIDSFLIITYTRAAAAELRGRILDELSLRCAMQPDNRRLRRQSTLCYRAQIGTIHSFCTSVLRENCHMLGISPDFRVGDEDKCTELKEKALERVLESAYEKMDTLSGFTDLVDTVGAGRDDSRLSQTILDLHGKMQSHAYPYKWAQQQSENLQLTAISDISETAWGSLLLENAKKTVSYWSNRLDSVWFFLNSNPAENAPIISAYEESLTQTMEQLRSLLRAMNLGWDKARCELPIDFPRLKPLKGYEYEDRKALVTSARDGCKKALASVDAALSAPSEELIGELSKTAPAMRALLDLTLEFDRLYSTEKRRLNLLDFSDLEHFAVNLLWDEQTGKPTDTATELSKRYSEIMIDEYQDVNSVQDLIFRCISRNGQNLFMVGDVKQSIYRFRLADPTIFIEKYHSYSEVSSPLNSQGKKILLQKNFRSDKRILYACNHVFSNLMSEELGEISYDSDAALFPRDDASCRGNVCLSVLAVRSSGYVEERPDKTYLEAKMVASQIKKLVEAGDTILDNGIERPISYGDIAILLRSPGTAGSLFRRALSELGIPVLSEQGSGFFSAPEIMVLRSLLSVIDNPHRDIPLTSALSSPVFSFTADELSMIRAQNHSSDFYTALTYRAATDKRCADFVDTLDELRSAACDLSVCQLLSMIYERLELPALCAAESGIDFGTQNLILMWELAAGYENSGYRGLFSFLAYLDRLEQRGEEPRSTSSDARSAVSIMSIHKSKGLEFPVVFLANTSRKFNTMDLRAPVLIHPNLGLGGKITDINRGIEYPTVARRAIAAALSSEMQSEEMRVLYVAMTRAKERLYISFTDRDPEALIAKLSDGLSSPLDPELLRSAGSMSQWLLSAALIQNDGLIDIEVCNPEDETSYSYYSESEPIEQQSVDFGTKLEMLHSVLNYRYPYSESVELPTKLTATKLPDDEDSEALSLEPARPRLFRQADFARENRPLTAAEKGTATHIVLQYIDFNRTSSLDDVESEIARILKLGQLNQIQANGVDRYSILNFFASPIGQRILRADKVIREFRFSLLCPAQLFYENCKNEDIMLQGVVDCCIEENNALTIIDYKTDYVTDDSLSSLAEHYTRQLSAYSYALSRIMQKPVKFRILHFLHAGKSIEV